MFPYAISGIVTDAPDAVERGIHQINEYLSRTLTFVGHMIADHPNEFITAFATCVVAWFTVTLAVSTRRLWQTTKDAADRQIKDTEILQRAYIAVNPGDIRPFNHALAPYNVAHVEVQNVGNLPARNVAWFIDTKIHADGALNDFPIDENLFYGNNVIPPGTTMRRSQNCPFGYDGERAFEKKGLSLYVWGEVRYMDGFGNKRFTRFCHRYNKAAIGYHDYPIGGGHQAGVPILRADGARFHRFGNDAD